MASEGEVGKIPFKFVRSKDAAPSADQVEKQDHEGDDQQDMNQAASEMKAEAEEPQD